MDLKALLADPRRRNLAVLAGVAILSLLLALGALWRQSSFGEHAAAAEQFFPGLAKDIRTAAHIHVASKAGAFDVVFVPEKGWVVPERANYPASFELVQRTLVGLAALQTIEPKTARPDWLHFLGLDAPPQGDGILIAVTDDKGHDLAALIAGKSEDIGDPSGATGLYVRHPKENQAWLVRSVLDPRAAIADWLNKTVLDVDRSRIKEVDVDPAGSPSFVLERALPSDPDFTLSPIPAGRSVADPAAPDGVAAAVTGFGFDDVAPAQGKIDLTNPTTVARVVTKTFDGLIVTVNVQRIGADYWASLFAEGAKPDAAKEAAAINAHAAGWAYKLPGFKGQLFMTTLDSLLKAPEPPATAPR